MGELADLLARAWREVLVDGKPAITVGSSECPVGRTRSLGLRTVAFRVGDHLIEGIEQNPEKTSQWAKLAREGKQIMQFSCRHRYFANVCDGRLTRYPVWKGLGLPD